MSNYNRFDEDPFAVEDNIDPFSDYSISQARNSTKPLAANDEFASVDISTMGSGHKSKNLSSPFDDDFSGLGPPPESFRNNKTQKTILSDRERDEREEELQRREEALQ